MKSNSRQSKIKTNDQAGLVAFVMAQPIGGRANAKLISLTVPLHGVSIASGSPINEGTGLKQLITDSRLPADSLITVMLWMRIGVIYTSTALA